jgi:hypothetical protein
LGVFTFAGNAATPSADTQVTIVERAATLRVRLRPVENLRIGVVSVEHDERTSHDHLSCSACSWQLGVSPREYAVRIAHRHDDSHQQGRILRPRPDHPATQDSPGPGPAG